MGVLRFQRAQSGWFPDLWRLAGSSQVIIGDRSLAPVSAAAAAQWEGMAVASATGWEIERAGNLGAAGLLAMMLLEMPAKGRTKEFAAAASGSVRTFLLEGGPGATAARRRAERVRQGGIDVDRLPTADISGFNPYASQPRYWRELAQDLRLQGVRDAETGEVFFPPVPARGRPVEPFRLQRRGRILTYTRDHVYPLGGPMSMVVVELDGGGRFYGQTAWDFPVEIGMRVRLVPRLLHRGGDLPHYFWKVVAD
ncbi:MAG: hypothetical protein KatS3mg011_2361 [Acidimicrobiia bacterium]|nr:MAG: hypothetical protein KatS3mg011_2361 [Acidimicrobiia bacterium]